MSGLSINRYNRPIVRLR